MPARYDALTLIAITLIVYSLSSVLHEGVGHGGACLLTSGHPQQMSSVLFDCDSPHPKIVASGGTVVNLIVGVLCWLLLRTKRFRGPDLPRLHYFLWLLMTVNLLQGGGYFLFSGVGNIGDWADVISGGRPVWAWRLGLIFLGVATYSLFIAVSLRTLLPFLPDDATGRVRVARKLMLTPYLAGGVLSCFAGMFNPVGMILVAISAAAASLGGTSSLAWSWQLLRGERYRSPGKSLAGDAIGIRRSAAWIAAASIIGVVFVAVLGPGIRFS